MYHVRKLKSTEVVVENNRVVGQRVGSFLHRECYHILSMMTVRSSRIQDKSQKVQPIRAKLHMNNGAWISFALGNVHYITLFIILTSSLHYK